MRFIAKPLNKAQQINSHLRRQKITDEPMFIKPELLGLPLASPLRRAIAMLIDLVCWLVLLFLVVFIGLTLIRSPRLLPLRFVRDLAQTEEKRKQADINFKVYVVGLFAKREPQMLPPEIREAYQNHHRQQLERSLEKYRFYHTMGYNSETGFTGSHFDEQKKAVGIAQDVYIGKLPSILSVPVSFLAYFTLMAWFFRGRSVGKHLLRIRVVRLDGKPLNLWETFGRAGGYTASLSTFALGFLESIWQKNRQTVHDRISGTVVVNDPNLPLNHSWLTVIFLWLLALIFSLMFFAVGLLFLIGWKGTYYAPKIAGATIGVISILFGFDITRWAVGSVRHLRKKKNNTA